MKKNYSPCIAIHKEVIEKTLATHPTKGKKLLEPLASLAIKNKLPFNILEDHEMVESDAEVHQDEGDLWFCLEGKAIFVYGGKLTKTKTIQNGTRVTVSPGDWLWIPAGQPHQHTCSATARLAIIKIPSKK